METLIDRLKLLAENEKITIGALERAIGASKGVLSRAIQNGTDIQAKWATVVVEKYPHYSARWLLTGEGSMLVADAGQEESPRAGGVFIPSEVVQMFGDMAATIRSQQELLSALSSNHISAVGGNNKKTEYVLIDNK